MSRYCLKKNPKYTFYFDETENSHGITFHEDGSTNLCPDISDSFIGVFCGVEGDRLEEVRLYFKICEQLIRQVYSLSEEVELKSSMFKTKHFVHGIASLDRKTTTSYLAFFKFLLKLDVHIMIAYLSKRECMVRALFPRVGHSLILSEHGFYGNMTRFMERYCDDEFYRRVRSSDDDIESFRNFMIERFREFAFNENLEKESSGTCNAFKQLIATFEEREFGVTPFSKIKLPYGLIFEWFRQYLDAINIPQNRCMLVIDGEEGQYEKRTIGMRHRFQDSRDEVMIRVCDLLAGFISKMVKSLSKATTPKDVYSVVRGDKDPEPLDKTWFHLDESKFELYGLLHIILELDGYDTAIASSYADPCVALHALSGYISSYGCYENFIMVDPEEHSQRFNAAVLCMLISRNKRMGEIAILDELNI